MKKIISATLFAIALGTTATHAQTFAPTGVAEEHFEALDLNKDGKITLDEYEQFMRDAFNKLDTNKDGSLSPKEAEPIFTAEEFAIVDKNKDGKITLEELLEQVTADFKRQDLNKDGSITR